MSTPVKLFWGLVINFFDGERERERFCSLARKSLKKSVSGDGCHCIRLSVFSWGMFFSGDYKVLGVPLLFYFLRPFYLLSCATPHYVHTFCPLLCSVK